MSLPFRFILWTALAVLAGTVPASAHRIQPGPARPNLNANRPPARPASRPQAAAKKEQRLSQWMERHGNESLQEQQRALEKEPGFHDLDPVTQQHARDELARLNSMTPQQRDRRLDRAEALGQMTPVQQKQYLAAGKNLQSLPPERRLLVAKAFKDLRLMPPAQRKSIMETDPRFRSTFTDQERSTLSTLLSVEP